MSRYNSIGTKVIKVSSFLGLLLTTSILLCSSRVEVDSRGFHREGGEVDSRYVNSLEGTPNTSSVSTPRKIFDHVYTNRPESGLVRALEDLDSDYLVTYQTKYKEGLEKGVDRKFPNLVLFPFRAEHNDPIGHLFATPDISDAVKRRCYRFFTKQLGISATLVQQQEFLKLSGML